MLACLHLLFTTGHTAPAGDALVRHDLVQRAIDLTTMLQGLLPGPEVDGLLALMLLTDARRTTRVDADGRLLLLEEQDRTAWDAQQVARGAGLVRASLTPDPGRYVLQAAIAAVHATAPSFAQTDWAEVVGLYDLLLRRVPTPVVALNRAVAIGFRDGPEAGLAALAPLAAEPALATYHYLPAARAALHRSLGQDEAARADYLEALQLCTNPVERAFLEARLQV